MLCGLLAPHATHLHSGPRVQSSADHSKSTEPQGPFKNGFKFTPEACLSCHTDAHGLIRPSLVKRRERLWHCSQAVLVLSMLLSGFEGRGSYTLLGFEAAVRSHLLAAWRLITLWAFTPLWQFTTGQWQLHVPTLQKVEAMIRCYAWEIFINVPHPSPPPHPGQPEHTSPHPRRTLPPGVSTDPPRCRAAAAEALDTAKAAVA